MLSGADLYLAAATIVIIILALIHSIVGERLLFKPYRTHPPGGMPRRYWGIIWASWHGVSLFALALAGVVFSYIGATSTPFVLMFFAFTLCVFSGLIAFGTRFRHPAWAAFLGLAALLLLALR
ncbi:hypothetical protein [Fretibacter rubidus]|uniref:hypothetical protein n=1 Tax=Fretibacter rubidus TaxID=570162 RepID=UPI00352A8706